MKKLTKILALAMLVVLSAVCLTACSSSSGGDGSFDRGDYDVIDNSDGQMYRRSADVSLRAKQSKLQEVSDQVAAKAKEFGAIVGYFNSNGNEDGLYRISYCFAVDNDKVTDFVVAVKNLGYKVSYENMYVKNVTDDYSDIQRQKDALNYKLTTLKQMQQEATTAADKLAILDEISDAESELAKIDSGHSGALLSGKSRVSVQVISDSHNNNSWIPVVIVLLCAATPAGVIAVIVILAVDNGKQRRKLRELQGKATTKTSDTTDENSQTQ